MPEAAGEVVVDHADRLHEGVDDRRADEVEALGLERLRDRPRGLVLGPDIGPAREVVLHRAAVDEPPQERREALPLLDREPAARAGNGAEDFLPVADDAGIAHQRLDVLGAEGRDHGRIEAGKGAAEILALPQDRDPGQPGLEAVEDQLLKQLTVVIGDIELVRARPPAAALTVGMMDESVGLAHAAGVAASPGKGKPMKPGFSILTGMPPARIVSPAASASAARSRRIITRPRPFAPVPTLPSLRSPAVTSDQGSAVKPSSYTTGTMRVRAVPRCCMRDTTSWPM